MPSNRFRLAHQWILTVDAGVSGSLVREFIRPAVRAVPSSMARQLGPCRISLVPEVEAGVASRWTRSPSALEISVAASEPEEHDIAMELLVCLGQALWELLSDTETTAYWQILRDEIDAGMEGEIDEQALEGKRFLLQRRWRSKSARHLEKYARASFAGTAAEYVHALWHDVSIRTGPDYLPPETLRRRLKLLAHWFPPDRGHRLFPKAGSSASGSATSMFPGSKTTPSGRRPKP